MHQGHHPTDTPATDAPAMPGQDAFGSIAEIVRLLEADPATDWSRVDLERLRQHLVDMNEVVLRAAVKPAQEPGELERPFSPWLFHMPRSSTRCRSGRPRPSRSRQG